MSIDTKEEAKDILRHIIELLNEFSDFLEEEIFKDKAEQEKPYEHEEPNQHRTT